jgi:hypothetical protein
LYDATVHLLDGAVEVLAVPLAVTRPVVPRNHLLDNDAIVGVLAVPILVTLHVVSLSTSWTGQLCFLVNFYVFDGF